MSRRARSHRAVTGTRDADAGSCRPAERHRVLERPRDATRATWLHISTGALAGQPVRTYYGLDLIISAGPRYRRYITLDFCDYYPNTRCADGYHEYERVRIMHRREILDGEPVVVPDIVGLGREQAARVLTARHLLYRVIPTGAGRDVVLSQRPAKGALAPARSDVVIRVDSTPLRSPFPTDAFVFDACGGQYSQLGYQ